jgi:hypothetical protein
MGETLKRKEVREMTKVTKDDVGKSCVYVDPRGEAFDALITAVWGPQCINVVYINTVAGQTDNYGQKLLRSTSVMHGEIQQAHGNYWLLTGEDRPAVKYVEDSAAA